MLYLSYGDDMKNKWVYLVIALLIITISIVSYACVRNFNKKVETNYINIPSEDKKDDNQENIYAPKPEEIPVITEKDLEKEGYKKTLNYNEYIENDIFTKDNSHILSEEEKVNGNKLTKNIKITMNAKTIALTATYTLVDKTVKYHLDCDNKEIDSYELKLDDFDEHAEYSITSFKENYSETIFDAKYLSFFKGEDNKEYVILYNYDDDPWCATISASIYDDEFNKLVANVEGKEKSSFSVYFSLGNLSNKDIYSEEIGYHTKLYVYFEEKEDNILMVLIDNKIRFIASLSDDLTYDLKMREYELSINDSKMSVKVIKDYDVYLSTSVAW